MQKLVDILFGISTHAPRTGSDQRKRNNSMKWKNFNPRSPHGERLKGNGKEDKGKRISTHAPRTGSDRLRRDAFPSGRYFNPRSPHGERLTGETLTRQRPNISTHAPRTGSDSRFAFPIFPS